MRTKAIIGCLFSLAWFVLIGLFMFGTMMGECFPGMGQICLTDHERNVRLLVILFGGVAIYVLVALVVTQLSSRSDLDE